MPLELQPAVEADAERAAQIEKDAYARNPFLPVFFPGPFPEPPAGRNVRAEELRATLLSNPSVRWWKVVDTDIEPSKDNEQMIGFAQWNINDGSFLVPEARTFDGPGMNVEACEAVFGGLQSIRNKRLETKKHVHLRMLHVDPKHQRRGAGKMLVMWGVEESGRLGLPAFLESSTEGHSLYLTCGFRDIDAYAIDLSKWGRAEKHVNYIMALEHGE
ncbi:acyl-CoA N-acyltransferase [Xylaria intraflava]|nr:acyl-CoA N-acyltransferase [Xylaria intraflava]